jgi:hypothetical protein
VTTAAQPTSLGVLMSQPSGEEGVKNWTQAL